MAELQREIEAPHNWYFIVFLSEMDQSRNDMTEYLNDKMSIHDMIDIYKFLCLKQRIHL